MRNQLVPRAWRVTLFAMLLALVGCNGPESSPQTGAAQSASKSQSGAPDGLGDLGLADFAGGVDAEFGVETFALGEPTLKIVFPVEAYKYEVDYTQTDPGDPGYNDQLDATQATLTFQVTNFAIGPTQGQILCWVDGQDPPASTTSASISNMVLGLQKGMRTITCTLANSAGEPIAEATAKANVYVQVTSIFGDEAPENRCFNDSECEDGNACSFHACISQRCDYKPDLTCCLTDVECTTGKVCLNPNTTNALCSACTADLDCDDGDDCTTDTCDSAVTGACKNIKADAECCKAPTDLCDDGKACTVDSCDVANETCLHVIPNGACCADSDCSSSDPCLVGVCVNLECRLGPNDFRPDCCGVDADCNDKNFCTLDKCETDMGGWTQCTHNPDPAKSVDATCCDVLNSTLECQDGNPCTYDQCNNYKCEHTDLGGCCAAAIDCDDGNPCTTDTCDKLQLTDIAGKCVNTKVGEISGAPAVPTVLPVTLGLAAHYDASNAASVIKDGSNAVSSWQDISGNGRHLTASGTAPAYNPALFGTKAGISFGATAATHMTTSAFPLTDDVTVFFAIRHQTPGSWGAYGHHGGRDLDWSMETNGLVSGNALHFQSSNDNSSTQLNLSTGSQYVLVGRKEGASRALTVVSSSGSQTAVGSGSTLVPGNKILYIGASDGQEKSNADFAEIIYYNRSLSSTEIDEVTAFLSARWSIGGPAAPSPLEISAPSYNPADASFVASGFTNAKDTAQSFIAPSTGKISTVDLWVSYNYSPGVPVNVGIATISGAVTTFVQPATTSVAPPSGKWTINLDTGVSVTAGTEYHVVVFADSLPVDMALEAATNVYPSGNVKRDKAILTGDWTNFPTDLHMTLSYEAGTAPSAVGLCCVTASDCDDGKFCTVDTCNNGTSPTGGTCSYNQPDAACCDIDSQCDDGDTCTQQVCVNHGCYFGPDGFKPNCCTDNGDCNDSNPCTVDTCNSTTEKCEFVSNGDPTCCITNEACDDADCTTYDFCNSSNVCESKPDPLKCAVNSDCEDGDPCTINTCDTSAACGQCKIEIAANCCSSDLDCNDAVPSKAGATPNPNAACTLDKCVNNVCANTVKDNCCVGDTDAATICDDDNACTIEYCLANTCRHTAPKGGCCATNGDCNDGNTCTTDSCGPLGGDGKGACQYALQGGCTCTPAQVAAGTNCNDNNPCTADSCVGGLCVNSELAGCCVDKFDCADGSPCTYDYCIFNQCVHSPTEAGAALCCSPATEAVDCAFKNTDCAKGVCKAQNDGSFQCEAEQVPVCTVNIGYCQDFQQGSDLTAMGWNPGDVQGQASNNWKVAVDTGLGPDKAAKLDWTPTQINYETCLQSPVIQAAGAQQITLQYDHEFLWRSNETTVRLLGTLDGAAADWSQSVLINQWSLTDNMGPETIDLTLPPELTGSNGLRLAFCVSGATSFDMEAFSLDNICIVKGQKPTIPLCPGNQIVPYNTTKTIPLKAFDYDYEAILSFSLVQAPSFVSLSSAMYFWLDTSWNANLRIQPQALGDVGTFPVTVKVSDGALYSLCTFNITVTYKGGYLVWRPSDVPEEMGAALATSIKTAVGNTPVQHITDLGLYDNLDGFAGVFVSLGVYPQNHVLDTTEAAKLSLYLASAGRLYMEGGETWFYDAQTSVHNLFSVSALADDAVETITGPLLGSNIYRDPTQDPPKIYQWGYNQAGEYNNLNDVIGPKSTAGTRQLLISNNPVINSGVQVGNNVPLGDYRTVASSILFAGVEASGPDVPNDMIKRILYFFDNGYVDCATAAQCDDGNDCTTDTCVTGECKHQNSCTCTSAGTISCGDTLSVASNAVGSTQALSFYGCEPTTPYTGKEFAVSYVATSSAPVNVTISNLSNPAARIFVTKGNAGTCDPAQCIASGSTSFSFPGAAGQTYFVIIDVGNGGTATADISFSCAQGEDCGNGQDDNGNGLADCADLASCCGFAACGEQCDGADNDCNGIVDDGCDDDQDGYCDISMTIVGNPPVCSVGVGDCNDALATVNPSAPEICANGKDDNCSGGGDEEGAQGCDSFWVDLDNDTFGAGGSRCLCSPQGNYKATKAGDCNDANVEVNPLAEEICANGIDDDCTGTQNDQNALGCADWYTDADLDGFGVLPSKCQCVASGTFQATQPGDCDDTRASSVPAGDESCNARDDDCDGLVDEGCDDDTDGYCDAGIGYEGIGEIVQGCIVTNNPTTLTCANGGTITAISKGFYGQPTGTCPGIGPGACNLTSALQTIKDLCLGQQSCVLAANTVTFGSDPCVGEAKSLAVQWTCTANGSPPPVCPQGGGDTDDLDGSINPQGMEICDNKDNNSDGFIDEGCDDDGDQFCDSSMVSIGSPSVCPKGKIDCDDTNADINPGEAEDCSTLADDDCDADPIEIDALNCTIFFADGDMDGYGTKQFVCACGPSAQYSAPKTGDCNDTNTAIHPGQNEVCDNVDTNCNGQTDDGCDDDNDGFCDSNLILSLSGASTCGNGGNDCDDTNLNVNPSKAEVCGNGIDDDCTNSQNDPGAVGCTTFYADGDNDGFGSTASKCQCEAAGSFKATNSQDCDDTNGLIRPGATEICDGADNNCNDVAGTAPASLIIAAGSYPEVSFVASGFANAKDTAQSFVASATGKIATVDLWVAYNYSPAAAVNVGIATFSGSEINFIQAPITSMPPASGQWTITLGAGVPVVSGNTYHLVVSAATPANDMALEAAGDVYAGGLVKRDTAVLQGNWTDFPAIDLHMNLNYEGAIAVQGVDEGCNDDGDNYCDSSMTTVGTPATCTGGGGDCNDNRVATNPGIGAETCDNIDDDCDGQVDDGCDDDGDGYCDGGRAVSNPLPSICLGGANDCDDLNNARNPGAQEVCGNSLDDNCDGSTNNIGALNCTTFYFDGDADSYGLAASICVCEAQGSFQATKTGDCNDSSTAVNPGATEVCGDSLDNDCDLDLNDIGAQGCSDFYFDDDQDGYGLTALKQCRCVGEGDYSATATGDCNDNVAAVKPGATEKCNNVDDNCVGGVDEGCNDDGDAYCDINMTTVGTPNVCALGGGDCDDTAAGTNPGLPEQCDDADNNCSGAADEGCDDDNDNVCDAGFTVVGSPTTCTLGGGDCNDTSDAIFPGAGETCATLYDDDCDGDANDINATGCNEYGVDADGDTYNDSTKATRCLCVPAGLYRGTAANDCNDQNDLIRPGITELCDGIDNNCNALSGVAPSPLVISAGSYGEAGYLAAGWCGNRVAQTFVANGSGKITSVKLYVAYSNSPGVTVNVGIATITNGGATTTFLATPVAGVPGSTPDSEFDVSLGAGVDVVAGNTYAVVVTGTGYTDMSFRNTTTNVYADGEILRQNVCTLPPWAAATPSIDLRMTITYASGSPQGIDEQCDVDDDGYCDAARTTVGKPAVCNLGGGDCNDANGSINPGIAEVCGNAVDENCDAQLNSVNAVGCTDYYLDSDNDTYAVNVKQCWCVPTGGYKRASATPADCDDTSALTNPGASEVCGDSMDNDCDGSQNDQNAIGCSNFFADADKDGFGTGSSECRCFAQGTLTTSLGGDCNDVNALINPGEVEGCDGVDNNCNGTSGEAILDQLVSSTSQTPQAIAAVTYGQQFQVGQTGKLHSVRFLYRNTGASAAATMNVVRGGSTIATAALTLPAAASFVEFTATFATKPNITVGEAIRIDIVPTGTLSLVSLARDNAGPYSLGSATSTASGTPIAGADFRFSTYVSEVATTTDEGCDDDNDDYCDAQMIRTGTPAACPNVGSDCNDNVATIKPLASETCNNIDDNCQGLTDEGCDDDNDQYCDSSMTRVGTPTVCTLGGNDCDDANAQVHSAKAEVCDNVDNNCNGQIDEGCDDDNDDYCDSAMTVSGNPTVCPNGPGDCADTVSTRNPGAAEVCDNIDNNCAGGTDETCVDTDGDGYCVGSVTAGVKCPNGGNDCDDTRIAVNPGATETCGTALDDDCDGLTNEVNATLCQNFYTDADNDGFGTGAATCQCAQAGGKTALVNGDCADANANVNPTKLEICDGIDNDCAGTPAIDGGCDDDGDTFCDGNLLIASTATCTGSSKPAVGTTKPGDDCNDASSAVKPGVSELCDNLDNGCNGFIDEGCDDDNDNYCDSTMTRVGTPGTCTVAGADCNDTNGLINPSRTENCTTAEDDNCDGSFSSINALGCVTYYQDGDNDTWGSNTSQCLCAAAAPFTATKRVDCDDGDASKFPSASAEICDNKDNNCNGVIDEGCDIDKDGYCATGMTVTSNQACTSNAIGPGLDCGPEDKNVAPGKPELCNNVDDNCNGNIDEGCDDDNDNYCDSALTTVGTPTTCTAGGGDCNDANLNIRPAGTETCDGVDNNCNAQTDEVNAVGCSTRYYDGDQDGFGVNSTICACGPTGLYTATNNTDCNDGCPTCKPGGGELVCDNFDNNCNGQVDEGCDVDNDNFCTSAMTTIGGPTTCTGGGGDCSDGNASIYPTRAEACNNIDDDCDLTIDEQAQDACGNAANATKACVSGGCSYTCQSGFSNNNGGWGDGCEVRNF